MLLPANFFFSRMAGRHAKELQTKGLPAGKFFRDKPAAEETGLLHLEFFVPS